MDPFISILTIYLFIVIGFIAKKVFHDEIHEKTLILISIYFLQPLLTFWGLTRAPIDYNLVFSPFLYFIIVTFVLIVFIILGKTLFQDQKEQSIFISASLIGNTGNLGIPLGIALFGEASVPYTSIINIANIFFIYTVGIYFFAKGEFDLKQSLISMIKIPILWFALFALLYNYLQLPINSQIDKMLEMASYATIVLQLVIFGVYLAKTQIKTINYKLTLWVSFGKLVFLPIAALIVISFTSLDPFVAKVLMLSFIVPLAVNNVNIAALYNCKPYDVTAAVLVSTLIFLIIFYFDLAFIEMVLGK